MPTQVWMSTAKRKTICIHCKGDMDRQYIMQGDLVVISVIRKQGKDTRTLFFHPVCWIVQGAIRITGSVDASMEILKQVPVKGRGYHSYSDVLGFNKERQKLMNLRRSLMYRIKLSAREGKDISSLSAKLVSIYDELKNYGGVPRKYGTEEPKMKKLTKMDILRAKELLDREDDISVSDS